MAVIDITIDEPALIKNPALKNVIPTRNEADSDTTSEDDAITGQTVEEVADEDATAGGPPTKALAVAGIFLAIVGLLTVRKLRGRVSGSEQSEP